MRTVLRRRMLMAATAAALVAWAGAASPAGEEAAARPAVVPAVDTDPFLAEDVGLIARDVTAWREGGMWFYLLKGDASAVQGPRRLMADALVVWFDEERARERGVAEIEIYAAGNVLIHLVDAVLQRDDVFVRWATAGRMDVQARRRRRAEPRAGDALYVRGQRARTKALEEAARIAAEADLTPGERAQPILNVYPTGPQRYESRSIPPPPGTNRRITVFTGGVDVVYKDPEKDQDVEIAADRIVLWTTEPAEDGQDTGARRTAERSEMEVYAEGNVAVFALGGTLRAPRVYYNLTTHQALLVQARVETYSKARQVPVIYEAERVRQFGRGLLTGQHAAVTTCDFGVPHFNVLSRRVSLTDQPVTDARGEPVLDEEGRPQTRQMATGWENTFEVGGVPFFYWPYAEHDLTRPETGVRRVRVRHDSDFGFQVLTESDLYYFLSGVLGQPPPGTDLALRLDYMSERGVAAGVDLEYDRGPCLGYERSYFLRDGGEDDGDFDPPTTSRGRFLWRHHHDLSHDMLLKAEVSWISDEAFLNEYFEPEFREGKDQETLVYLKKQQDQWAATLLTKFRINDFQSETEYLPQAALYVLGVPLFDDTATLISRSEIGGVRLRLGDPEREDLAPIPDAQEASVFRMETRDELYRPFSWGIFQVNPFVQGRAGYFSKRAGERMEVDTLLPDGTTETTSEFGSLRSGTGRFSAAAGVRTSTQFWRVYPTTSDFWNIDRLRHIITPQFTYVDLFGLNVPSEDLVPFDAVDDVDKMRVLQTKLRQRLQTHRGVGESRRVVDWVTLDLTMDVYPDADRDNDGQTLGNLTSDLEWRVTDVVSLVSECEVDTEADDIGRFSVGVGFDQTPRYSLFVGHRFINASDSSATTFNLAYQLNVKWRIDLLTQYDWGEAELLQNRIRLHRDLHDFILNFGILHDGTRDDTRIFLELMPKGLPELAVRYR